MTVQPGDTVPALFADRNAFPEMPVVFATAKMVGLMEWACVEQLRPYYEAGEGSLGIHVDVDHTAPTLPGQVVTVETEVEDIDGRFIWFRVTAHDGIDQIGAGRHRRAVIRNEKFNDRLNAKRAQTGLEG
ncbi:MAG TPA: thioesterase family protein [Paracoccus sp. (in: a-proteobacteria)]|nr:thioesterase family protein [Paracoccus sp. (in: a-proteobacteria)]HRM73801.1 thioesterase family protein [Paracoccus sp. (in: a-proteobacteria)]